MKVLLIIAGSMQVALAFAHLAFPARFRWKEEAARMSRLNEQIFHVHTFFLCLALVLFGVWTAVLAPQLAAGDHAILSGGIAFFWFCRLIAQWFIYDTALWRGKTFETIVHIGFSLIWIFFTGLYAWAACVQL